MKAISQPPIAPALEVFARGFAFTRSMTYPCQAKRVGPLWVIRDEDRPRGDYRNEEWVAWQVAPEEVHRTASKHTRGRYAVCAICAGDGSDAPVRSGYKQIGYRLRTTEPLMVHTLQRIPRCDSPAEVQRVRTPELAERVNKLARSAQVRPEHFARESSLRQYAAIIGGEVVGYVRSISVHGDSAPHATWCSNMFVRPEFRRRGIARALLSRMLTDDRVAGSQLAVLLASHVGARLYPVAGYEQIATLLLYSPRRAVSPQRV